MDRFFGIFGIILIFAIAFLMSNNRKAINYKTVGTGFALQILLAVFVFKVPCTPDTFSGICVQGTARAGIVFEYRIIYPKNS